MRQQLAEFLVQYFPHVHVISVTHNEHLHSFDIVYIAPLTPTPSEIEAAVVGWFRDSLLTNWETIPTTDATTLRLWFPRTVK